MVVKKATEKSFREQLVDKEVALIFEIGDIVTKHLPGDVGLDLTCKIHELSSRRVYLATHTDEEINSDIEHDNLCMEKCPITFVDGEPEPDYPLKELCPWKECREYDTCWAVKHTSPPGSYIARIGQSEASQTRRTPY